MPVFPPVFPTAGSFMNTVSELWWSGGPTQRKTPITFDESGPCANAESISAAAAATTHTHAHAWMARGTLAFGFRADVS